MRSRAIWSPLSRDHRTTCTCNHTASHRGNCTAPHTARQQTATKTQSADPSCCPRCCPLLLRRSMPPDRSGSRPSTACSSASCAMRCLALLFCASATCATPRPCPRQPNQQARCDCMKPACARMALMSTVSLHVPALRTRTEITRLRAPPRLATHSHQSAHPACCIHLSRAVLFSVVHPSTPPPASGFGYTARASRSPVSGSVGGS